LVTATVVTACGGAGDPSAAVRSYLNAIATGDGATACKQISQQAIAQIVRGRGSSDPTACANIIKQASQLISPTQKKELQSAKVTTASTSGNTARVRITLGGRTRTVALTQSGGKWQISGGFGATG
jgi:hypothetical protein